MKKIISSLCAAAMAASLLTGCGNNSTPSPDVQDIQEEETTNAADSSDNPERPVINFDTHHQLSNPNADEVTQRVYDYLCENFGEYIIACQQESTWMDSPDYEMNIIQDGTGKLPAMRGLDYMNGDFKGVNQRAIEWWEKGGLVTICWHTGINGRGYNESKNDVPDFEKLFDETTPEYENMIKNWDRAAKYLGELRDAGVPVLWRPFHEFDGQWFWWGKGGSENFVKLWQMMYDRYTNEFGLTNLIWVLGYADNVKDGWYVGDDYCDIIGSDTYNNSTHLSAWNKLEKVTEAEKPLAFHECGNVPPVADFEKDGCIWSWFMIWHTDWLVGNDMTNLSEVYNSDRVITLDELPAFK
ncbi:MAG: hypothetical protein J1F11_02455 [Oscillospiraceae bacterium]|nr:hypothetical protein [Oscillospiraceae bacterium]